MIWFLLGAWIGAFGGFVAACLCHSAARADRVMEGQMMEEREV